MKRLILSLFVLCAQVSVAYAVEVKEVTSEHGIKAWLVEEHALPLVVVKVAFTGSGYAYDAAGKEGRANMTASLLMEGAGDMDAKSFSEAIESRAISMTAGADEDYFHLSMETLSDHAETAFSYLALVLTNPRFDAEAIERTRRQMLSIQAQQEQEPAYQLMESWQKTAFPNHPYSKPPVGTKASVAGLSKDDLQFVVSNMLTRENIIIAVVGDITPDALKRLLDDQFGNLPAQYMPDTKVEEAVLPAPAASAPVVSFDIPQTMVMFGFPSIKREDPAYYAAHVMNHLLGGGGALNSRLGKALRGERGLTYGVGTYLDPAPYASTLRGRFATRNEQAGAALEVLKSTLKKFSEEGITQEELDDAKKFITGSFVLGLDSNTDVANFLINMQVQNLGMDYLNRRNELMQAVTRDDVMAMAKRIIAEDKLLVVMLGKPSLDKSGQAQ
ncbi:MAG: M16 family metallopeptidase [Alphaproteobacteria bacterium]